MNFFLLFFFSSRRRHTRCSRDWSSDVCSSDLITSGFANAAEECFNYGKLLVLNQKDPRENITTLGFKSIRPDGSTRAQKTWALMGKADISHIVNVAVGYPSG